MEGPFGGKETGGCIDAIAAHSMHAHDEGTLDNSFTLPISEVRDTSFMKSRYPILITRSDFANSLKEVTDF
jgi:hypothetical protein